MQPEASQADDAAQTAVSPPKPARARFVEAGLLAGLILALVELWTLGPASVGLAWVVTGLFLAVAASAALVLEGVELVVARAGLAGWRAAWLRATPSLIVTVPVARTLFEGSFASQLPGAASARLWLPALGLVALAGVVGLVQRFASTRARTRWLGLGLLGASALAQLVNRHVKPSELFDLHTGIAVASLVALMLGLVALGHPRMPAAPTWRAGARAGMLALAGVNTAACLRWGLESPEDRWTLATAGTEARLYVRTARALLDGDGDGYAAALGGGDCDDADPERNPGAVEIPDNALDEDCDGVAAVADERVAQQATQMRADLEAWIDEDEPRQFLDRTRALDFVLISVDALRADMLTDTVQNRRDFPNLLALADEGVHFTRAFAPAAGTDLSVSTMLTGRIDPFRGVDTTLAEALHATGRHSHAVIPSEVLRYAGKALLTRGFDHFDRLVNDRFEQDIGTYSTSQRATELALAGLDAMGEGRTFSWVHYFDVHEHAEIDLRNRRLREIVGEARPRTTPERYRATVKLVDRAIGALLDGLRERGRLERTIVILVSDHGESLGEDPRLPANHGLYVYNALVHVPLVIRVPGQAGRAVSTPISLVDLAPTIAQLADAELAPVDGTTLLASLVPDAPPALAQATRPIVLNESDQHGVIAWPYKLMRRPNENLVELYDLEHDFAEHEDLAAAQPERVRALLAVYHALPSVHLDRTRRGRRARELAARNQPQADEDGSDGNPDP